MVEKLLKLGNKNIKIMCSHNPYFQDRNTIIFGFPFNIGKRPISKEEVNQIKGYFLQISIKNNEIEIINDIAGLYRFYYMETTDTLYFSNDFMTLFNILSKEQRTFDNFEYEFWDKHRYTTGGNSVCKEIKKIKPAHIYKFTDSEITEELYYKDFKNRPNRKKHFEELLADLRDTVKYIKQMPQKKFLLFSGGVDSTLLVKMLQEQNVDFIPVFGKQVPTNSMNYDDELKIKYSAELLGIKPLEIEIDISEKLDPKIVDIMFLDRSITQLFFKIAEKLKEQYGNNIILLNGQASDSIFNFGATEKEVFSIIQRMLLFSPLKLINNILLKIVQAYRAKYKIYRIAKNNTEYNLAFFDEKAYLPVIDKTKNEQYYHNIKKIINNIRSFIKNKYAYLMYLKIYGFMQGSDDYVNVQCCEYNGIKSLFLFATPQIIYSTVKNTDYNYEILHPKSVTYKILKDVFDYKMPNFKKEKNYKKSVNSKEKYADYEQKIHLNFYQKINSLEFDNKDL